MELWGPSEHKQRTIQGREMDQSEAAEEVGQKAAGPWQHAAPKQAHKNPEFTTVTQTDHKHKLTETADDCRLLPRITTAVN